MSELIEPLPGSLVTYRPGLRYHTIVESAYGDPELAPMRNLAAALFRLENSRAVDDIRRVLDALVEWLADPSQERLSRALTTWLSRVLLPARAPGVTIPEMQEMQEAQAMLAQRVKEWTKEWWEGGRQEGRQEGLEEGLQKGRQSGLQDGIREGRQEGEESILIELLMAKFGPVSDRLRARIAAADTETRMRWAKRVLTAERLDDVFGGKND